MIELLFGRVLASVYPSKVVILRCILIERNWELKYCQNLTSNVEVSIQDEKSANSIQGVGMGRRFQYEVEAVFAEAVDLLLKNCGQLFMPVNWRQFAMCYKQCMLFLNQFGEPKYVCFCLRSFASFMF